MTVSTMFAAVVSRAQSVCAAFSCAENNSILLIPGASMLLASISVLLPIPGLLGLIISILLAVFRIPESRQTA